MPKFKDLTNMKFGKLTVLRRAENKSKLTRWECMCDCGNKTTVYAIALMRGATKGCGCLRHETKARYRHGKTCDKIHGVWNTMLQRCFNPNIEKYKNYGGRGITVCERWLDFENFLSDMGEPPKGYSLDRIDNFGNYEPDNCKWSTQEQQQNNKRNNIIIEYNGEVHTLAEWSTKLNVRYGSLWNRYKRKWSTKEMFETPLKTYYKGGLAR